MEVLVEFPVFLELSLRPVCDREADLVGNKEVRGRVAFLHWTQQS